VYEATWENPILLGRNQLIEASCHFAGNRFIFRAEILISRIHPAGSGIKHTSHHDGEQYEVTLDITGPASRLSLNYRSDLLYPRATSSVCWRWARLRRVPRIAALLLRRLRHPAQRRCSPRRFQINWGGRLEKLFGISRFRVDPFLAGTNERAKRRGARDD